MKKIEKGKKKDNENHVKVEEEIENEENNYCLDEKVKEEMGKYLDKMIPMEIGDELLSGKLDIPVALMFFEYLQESRKVPSSIKRYCALVIYKRENLVKAGGAQWQKWMDKYHHFKKMYRCKFKNTQLYSLTSTSQGREQDQVETGPGMTLLSRN